MMQIDELGNLYPSKAQSSASRPRIGLLKTDLLTLLQRAVPANPAEWLVPNPDGDEAERCFFCGQDEGQGSTEFVHDSHCAGMAVLAALNRSRK